MKLIRIIVLFVVGVAATYSRAADGSDFYLGLDETGNGIYGSLEQYQDILNNKRIEIDNISNAAQQQKAKIDELWKQSQTLVDGLVATKQKWDNAMNGEDGLINTMEKWMDWLAKFEKEWKDLNIDKKFSDINKRLEEKDPTDLSGYLTKSEAASTYATKATTDNHETRITALESRPGGGGGGGCGENCKLSWEQLYGFFGGAATITYPSGTGDCVKVEFSPGTATEWLKNFPIAYYGDSFEYDIEAAQMWDTNLNPLFNPSENWAGDGLAIGEVVLGEEGTAFTPMEVQITEEIEGNLGEQLDGTGQTSGEWGGIAVVDEDGHLRKGAIGSVSVAVDGTTIERIPEEEDTSPVLKVKTSGIVDGITIVAESNVAHVETSALCDDITIGVNGDNKLCIKWSSTPWDFSDGWFKNAYVIYGGSLVEASGTHVGNATEEDYYVKVTISNGSASAEVTTNPTKPDNGWTIFVGHVSNGVLTSGIRTTPAFLVYE